MTILNAKPLLCRVVACDCASCMMKYDVYTELLTFSRIHTRAPLNLANTFAKFLLCQYLSLMISKNN